MTCVIKTAKLALNASYRFKHISIVTSLYYQVTVVSFIDLYIFYIFFKTCHPLLQRLDKLNP